MLAVSIASPYKFLSVIPRLMGTLQSELPHLSLVSRCHSNWQDRPTNIVLAVGPAQSCNIFFLEFLRDLMDKSNIWVKLKKIERLIQ
jgi:hypothetical protein